MSREKSSGLSVTTLLLASASAAAAALIVPMIWQRGTVVAAAVTPVIVSLVSEALKRPVERVSSVGVWRRTPSGTVVREPGERVPALAIEEGVVRRREEPFDPLAAGRDERLEVAAARDDPFGLREPERRSRRRPVLIALVTGLLAFAIAAVVVTASELAIFGDSVSRPQRTTFFGGAPSKAPAEKPERDKAPAEVTPAPEASTTPTPTPEAGSTPAPSATPAPGGAATPAPSTAPTAVPPVPTP
ncbi:MAG TPA: hypothetical protein VES79_06150 [Solirubrobacteraceae bacterium]|nr:hypothetical protein [Solirubrobacteraceae bacterium]